MKYYNGAIPGKDKPRGDFKYTKEHPFNDHTQFNFRPFRGKYYGHVPGSKGSTLEKLGGKPGVNFIDGVIVVWIATNPDLKGKIIVGWYKNARVWHERRKPKGALVLNRKTKEGGDICEFSIEAPVSSSRLLLPGNRYPLDSSRSGQSPFWYGNTKTNAFISKIISGGIGSKRRLIKSITLRKGGGGWNQNVKERQEIERRAMEWVRKVYQREGYRIYDVSAQNLGYDIRAVSASGERHIEVKGSKGDKLNIELTPNEFACAKKEQNVFYLCVVISALSNHRKMRTFQPLPKCREWFDESGIHIHIKEKVGAIIKE